MKRQQLVGAVLDGMRRSEARRARAAVFSSRLQDEMGGTFGTVGEAGEVVALLLEDPEVASALGDEGVTAVGEIGCIAWNLAGGDRERLTAWFRAPQPALGQRSPRQCMQAGDLAALLGVLRYVERSPVEARRFAAG